MKKLFTLISIALAGLFVACATTPKAPEAPAPEPTKASATLAPTEGNAVQGTVSFEQDGNGGVKIIAEVSGLTPGSHGFHVHAMGDCSAPDASSAGGHFNPHDTEHGKAGEGMHHAGDLPSLEADENGNAKLEVVLNSVTLVGEHSIIGRSLIVHADPDDYVSQPTGNAGARVACAIIEKS